MSRNGLAAPIEVVEKHNMGGLGYTVVAATTPGIMDGKNKKPTRVAHLRDVKNDVNPEIFQIISIFKNLFFKLFCQKKPIKYIQNEEKLRQDLNWDEIIKVDKVDFFRIFQYFSEY